MHTKTMEGLAGANMSMKLMNTPMRVYKEAERRGDTAVMERVMGYVGELADKAEDYQKKAGMGIRIPSASAKVGRPHWTGRPIRFRMVQTTAFL